MGWFKPVKNSKEQIELAMRRHRAGDMGGAEKIYRQILDVEPNHPDALHLLGVLSGQRGKNDAAVDLIGRAVKIKPDYPDAIKNLGTILAQMNRFEEAIGAYRKVVEMRPNDADSHRDLAVVLRMGGRLEEAAASFSKAAQLNPGSPDAQRNLAKALTIQGRVDEAIDAYLRAIALRPDWADAHFNLAELYQSAGQLEKALAEYRRVSKLKPDMFESHNNMANILRGMGRWDESIAAYKRALQLKPTNAAVHFNLGQAFQAADRLEEAMAEFKRTIQSEPDHFAAHASMAMVLATLQRFEQATKYHAAAAAIQPEAAYTHLAMGEILLHKLDATAAIEHYRRAVEIDPDNAATWNRLGMALRAAGRFDEAADCFRRVLAIQPGSATGYKGLVATGRVGSDSKDIEKLTAMINHSILTSEERISIGFALGKMLDDADRYEEAFGRFAEANGLVKQQRELTGERYNPAVMHSMVDELIKIYTPSFFEARREWGDPSEVPVFVVGMPRSGTTLVQQIAASHPQAHGAGELRDINQIEQSGGRTDLTSTAMGWSPEPIRKAAEQYLRHVRELNPTASRVVDKMPGNVLALGFICTLFPRARVILCRRDPRDNCLSCFFQLFATGNLFAFDLAHCGENYLATDRLMEHWKRVLPLRMLEMQYESVVADLEGQSRRLIEFLGLPWDPACLEFYRAKNTVLTASVWQVRQPIYSSSVGRWRHYEKHLGPLLEVLGRGERPGETEGSGETEGPGGAAGA
jgi:tetratricopeptide (TPR) repeat protein